MKAAKYETFGGPLELATVADPEPSANGVVLQVMACGVCRSDWHGWRGQDADIVLPHVPGHELAGVVVATGSDVRNWRMQDRVTVPFVCGCGHCLYCRDDQQQVCPNQTQPGFTHWGSYAQFVRIDAADVNLVALDENLDFVTAASLGCRFATAWRAVTQQGAVQSGEWVAVHGCGGVGLSAVMIAAAFQARVIAVDIAADRLSLARDFGAEHVIDASRSEDVVAEVQALTQGGAALSIDALGSLTTCLNSLRGLRRQGRHVQVGLMVDDYRAPPVPMDEVMSKELKIIGSHGMQAPAYEPMLAMIRNQALRPEQLVAQRVSLAEAAAGFADERYLQGSGTTVIDRFD